MLPILDLQVHSQSLLVPILIDVFSYSCLSLAPGSHGMLPSPLCRLEMNNLVERTTLMGNRELVLRQARLPNIEIHVTPRGDVKITRVHRFMA
jgi:hypothetical protein